MDKQSKWILPLLLGVTLIVACAPPSTDFEQALLSPDGKIAVTFLLESGRPFYEVTYEGRKLLAPSALGFRFKAQPPIQDSLMVCKVRKNRHDETWEPIYGTVNRIRNHYHELQVTLREMHPSARIITIVFRAYNDGVALRYLFPEQKQLQDFQITDELTQFNFTQDCPAWWIPADYDSYEHLYRQTPLREVKAVNTPITLQTKEGLCVSIHEADLTDYAGMTLEKSGADSLGFGCVLVPWPDGIKVKAQTPQQTPWRTLQITAEPAGLITSHLILNLNPPCKLKRTDWIKPMKYVGIWWGMHIDKWTWHAGPRHGATTENVKRYIDFAAQHGFDAVLVEGWNQGWESWLSGQNVQNYTTPYRDLDLETMVSYARQKGVLIIGHHETGGNVPAYERQLAAAFDYYKDLGIKAIKTGYAGKMFPTGQHHHGQWMVNHYRKVMEKAVEYRFLIDAHEPIKATGIRRTYPHMMTREGARGMEYNAWSEGNSPEHTTILPFTRLLGGPMDYTPGIFDLTFDEYKPNNRVWTTLAKQLAYYVVLYSPLQMAADLIENYADRPAFKFIEDVPVNWDTTVVLAARIGDYVAIARRADQEWYVGIITDEHPRWLSLPLDFLAKSRLYQAEIYSDAAMTDLINNPQAIEINTYQLAASDSLTIALAGGGGAALRIVLPKEPSQPDLPPLKIFNDHSQSKWQIFKNKQ